MCDLKPTGKYDLKPKKKKGKHHLKEVNFVGMPHMMGKKKKMVKMY